ncbi:head-tail adaptor protein [Parasphingorhabdus sp.]|uniref:phage head completion protein n=1 Tax=Parasphingorhabdus sp. TaxID=2709688 RepID=UPI003A9588A9
MGQEFSGILRERISIERQAPGRDALASAEPQYLTVGVFWAAAEALHGGTTSEAESRSAMPRWRFILRETRAIKPGDQLVWGDHVMTISSVILEHRLIPKTILQAEEKR